MANINVTPNMNLPNPVPGVDPGPDYAINIQSCINITDQHNHSAGQGVQIQPSGLNISSDLPFNGNNATLLRTVRLISQGSPIPNTAPDVGCLYVSGNELWYNDYTGGNQVQITTNGLINATSSGIASGTASASFSAGTLIVKSSSTSFANIDMQSAVLSNAGNLSNQLTLLAPALSSSYDLTLPTVPLALSILTIDTSGNMGYTMNAASADPVGQAMSSTGANAVLATSSNANMGGKAVQESGKNLVVSNANATNSLAIIRGIIGSAGNIDTGEGFTIVANGGGQYTATWASAFADTPAVTITTATNNTQSWFAQATSAGCVFANGVGNLPFSFIAVGQRA